MISMYKIFLTVFTIGILLISMAGQSFADRGHDQDKAGNWHESGKKDSGHSWNSRHDERGHDFHKGYKTGSQLDSKYCNTDNAKKVINVNQRILNSADSGVAGNYWANDDYYRQIDVWQQDDGSFCAIVKYEGRFVTFAGPSPNGTGTVDAGIAGIFYGGYRTVNFKATLAPTVATHGSIGTYDYQCDVSGTCPGFVDWTTLYFKDVSGFDLAWWGWQYTLGMTGIGFLDGNHGNIT